jgi:two-component system, OmpR family, response regulator ChvI
LRKRILIVDDEVDITDALKTGLERRGFVVVAFNDPLVALSKFKAGQCDVAILDIKMPNMTGFELYRQLKSKDGQIKIVFLTAFDIYREEFARLFPEIMAQEILKKPISVAVLANRLEEVLLAPLAESG